MGTLRKITLMSVKTLGWNALSAPSTLTRPNSSTRPSSFTVARVSVPDPRPATTPPSPCTRVANGSTRLRSAKLIALSSIRTRDEHGEADARIALGRGRCGSRATHRRAAGVRAGWLHQPREADALVLEDHELPVQLDQAYLVDRQPVGSEPESDGLGMQRLPAHHGLPGGLLDHEHAVDVG